MKHFAAGFVLSLILGACASSMTPPFDKADYPCGDPQAHYCPPERGTVGGRRTCCANTEDCGGGVEFFGCPVGMCCNSAGLMTLGKIERRK